jgi:L-rhamnose mutarotase
MEVEDDFSFERKGSLRMRLTPTVVKWENLMWTYQQAIPVAKTGRKMGL